MVPAFCLPAFYLQDEGEYNNLMSEMNSSITSDTSTALSLSFLWMRVAGSSNLKHIKIIWYLFLDSFKE